MVQPIFDILHNFYGYRHIMFILKSLFVCQFKSHSSLIPSLHSQLFCEKKSWEWRLGHEASHILCSLSLINCRCTGIGHYVE